MAKIKGDKCLVGQKEQNPLPKRVCGLLSAKLLEAPASLAGAKRWGSQFVGSGKAATWVPQGPWHTAQRQCLSDLVHLRSSPLAEGLSGCPEGLARKNLNVSPHTARPHGTLLKATTSVRPCCSGHGW